MRHFNTSSNKNNELKDNNKNEFLVKNNEELS